MYRKQGIFQHHFQCKKVRTILDKIQYKENKSIYNKDICINEAKYILNTAEMWRSIRNLYICILLNSSVYLFRPALYKPIFYYTKILRLVKFGKALSMAPRHQAQWHSAQKSISITTPSIQCQYADMLSDVFLLLFWGSLSGATTLRITAPSMMKFRITFK